MDDVSDSHMENVEMRVRDDEGSSDSCSDGDDDIDEVTAKRIAAIEETVSFDFHSYCVVKFCPSFEYIHGFTGPFQSIVNLPIMQVDHCKTCDVVFEWWSLRYLYVSVLSADKGAGSLLSVCLIFGGACPLLY